MKISKKVQKAMKPLQLDILRKHQIKPINSVLDGQDTLVVAPTGSGKSAIFQVPAIVGAAKGKWTLVFEPTVSLIADQVNRLQDFGIAAEMLTGRNRKRRDTAVAGVKGRKTSKNLGKTQNFSTDTVRLTGSTRRRERNRPSPDPAPLRPKKIVRRKSE